MFTVAIIGPDGSGKSMISKKLVGALPDLHIKRIYMGINLESSNLMLPHTRLLLLFKKVKGGRPDMAGPYLNNRGKVAQKGVFKRLLSGLKGWLLLLNRLSEEWFRLLVTRYYLRRGNNVLFDRHFLLDYYFHDMEYHDREKPLARRVHGFLLKKYYPWPNLVIYLDAPAELLFQRKGEGTVELLEQYRKEYLALRSVVPAFSIVDASQPVEVVVAQAAEIIRSFASGFTSPMQGAPIDQKPSSQWR